MIDKVVMKLCKCPIMLQKVLTLTFKDETHSNETLGQFGQVIL